MRLKLFLAGDVMLGRGIDQILPNPSDPVIFEDYIGSARDYVRLAEKSSGAIPKPVGFDYVWGDALDELAARRPDARIVNLETAITLSGAAEPKGINYRMNPANIPVLKAAAIDCCTLANNHVLDWGVRGLLDTLEALNGAGIKTAGAGRNAVEASRPAIIETPDYRRIVIYAFGVGSSGIPASWAAGDRPGVRYLPDLSEETAYATAASVLDERRPEDIVVVSIHWGSNWGYKIPDSQMAFAHTLIDLGACDILFGHSSHHARPIEIYRGKPILYGCGDFINDYEGIEGQREFRGDLAPGYFLDVGADGILISLTVVLFQRQRFRLHRASNRDVHWFKQTLNAYSRQFGAQLSTDRDGSLSAIYAFEYGRRKTTRPGEDYEETDQRYRR